VRRRKFPVQIFAQLSFFFLEPPPLPEASSWVVRARFDAAAGDPLPIAKAYAPDLVLVSAGFDAAAGDPLGEMEVSPSMFGRMCRQ